MKKRQMAGIGALLVAGMCAFLMIGDGRGDSTNSVATVSGRGATQKWVEAKIAAAKEDLTKEMNEKFAALAAQISAAVDANDAVLADTSNTNRLEEAAANLSLAAQPTVSALFDL